MPKNLVIMIDMISKQYGISRSRYISKVLHEKLTAEREQNLREAYNRIFSDSEICREQLETTKWFEGFGQNEGQEW